MHLTQYDTTTPIPRTPDKPTPIPTPKPKGLTNLRQRTKVPKSKLGILHFQIPILIGKELNNTSKT